MKTLVKKSLARITKNQTGFTLIELLVVVGIIVALAAIIVPAVAKFSQKGEEGGAAGEHDTVQTALDAMMADKILTGVAPTVPGIGTTDVYNIIGDTVDFDADAVTTAYMNGDAGGDFVRDPVMSYWYCWDAAGNVFQAQDALGDPASVSDYGTEALLQAELATCNGVLILN